MNSAPICRNRGWGVGTRLAGDNGHGMVVIEITWVGEDEILAKMVFFRGTPIDNGQETSWNLNYRDWVKVA